MCPTIDSAYRQNRSLVILAFVVSEGRFMMSTEPRNDSVRLVGGFLALLLVGCGSNASVPSLQSASQNATQNQSILTPLNKGKHFVVSSTTFKDNTKVPQSMVFNGSGSGCTGGNKSPQLSWSKTPAGTRSYTVLMFDVTASFTHWGMYNIPASTTSLPENAGTAGSPDGQQILNDFGIGQQYDGPCPPPGPAHHYVITVFALDCTLTLPSPLGKFPPFPETLLYALIEAGDDILGTAQITGLYST